MERKKKSRKERVLELIEKRGLVSFMNTTKWKELKRAVIEEMPFQPKYYMKIVEMETVNMKHVDATINETMWCNYWKGEAHWGYLDDPRFEDLLSWDCFATPFWAIEWIKVKPKKGISQDGLVVSEIVDATKQFVAILKRYNIPYEEENGVYTIYGYRGS